MIVRRVQPGDERMLREVRLRALRTDPDAYCSTYADTVRRDPEVWRHWALGHAGGDDACTLLAVAGERAVGLIRVEREPHRPGAFGIYSLWVAPELRRRGLARRLLVEAEAWIVAAGGTAAELVVLDDIAAARRLYERAGYVLDGRREPAGRPGAVELGMHKSLT